MSQNLDRRDSARRHDCPTADSTGHTGAEIGAGIGAASARLRACAGSQRDRCDTAPDV